MRSTFASIFKIICFFSLPLVLGACQPGGQEAEEVQEDQAAGQVQEDPGSPDDQAQETPEAPPAGRGSSQEPAQSSPGVPGPSKDKRPDPGIRLNPVQPPEGEE